MSSPRAAPRPGPFNYCCESRLSNAAEGEGSELACGVELVESVGESLAVAVYTDGQPQQRPVHFEDVRMGQAVVAGIHTVDEAGMAWIRELTRRHQSVALHCDGREVWKFENASSGEGYFPGRGATDEASA